MANGGGRQCKQQRLTVTNGGDGRGQTMVGDGGQWRLAVTDNSGDSRGRTVGRRWQVMAISNDG